MLVESCLFLVISLPRFRRYVLPLIFALSTCCQKVIFLAQRAFNRFATCFSLFRNDLLLSVLHLQTRQLMLFDGDKPASPVPQITMEYNQTTANRRHFNYAIIEFYSILLQHCLLYIDFILAKLKMPTMLIQVSIIQITNCSYLRPGLSPVLFCV